MSDPVLVALILWMSAIPCAILAIFNFDRIAVFILGRIDVPIFDTAWMIAELIYHHPEQFEKIGSCTWKHSDLGEIRTGSVYSVHVLGPFGDWEPNFIERRIIWNAIAWRQRESVRKLVRASLNAPRKLMTND